MVTKIFNTEDTEAHRVMLALHGRYPYVSL